MKIVWIVSNFPNSYNTVSGIFFKQTVEILAENSVDITVIALTPYSNPLLGLISKKWDRYRKYPKMEFVNGVKIYRPRYLAIPKLVTGAIVPYLMFYAIHKHKSLQGANLINAHYAFPFGWVARLLSDKYKIPHIVTLHGSDVNHYLFHNDKTKYLFYQSLQKANLINAVSKRLADITATFLDRPVSVINLGLKVKKFDPEFKKQAWPFKFIFVGSLTKSKGLHLIVHLLERNVELTSEIYKWIIIGDGEYRDKLNQFKNVLLTGNIENYQVIQHMQDAHLMVFPSLNEGMPHVLKEAGSAGLPIIASSVGGIPDFLSNGERGGVFKPNDYESFEKAVYDSIHNYGDMLEKAKKLKKYVFQNFDIDKNVQQLIQDYKKIVDNNCVNS